MDLKVVKVVLILGMLGMCFIVPSHQNYYGGYQQYPVYLNNKQNANQFLGIGLAAILALSLFGNRGTDPLIKSDREWHEEEEEEE